MKIYANYATLYEYKDFIWRDEDKFFVRLVGINIATLEPVYQAWVRIWASPGILYLEFPKTLIMLMERKPWIHIEKSEGEEVE